MTARHIHLVGIGGAGLSAIARVLHERGNTVTGSDMHLSNLAQQLAADGVIVFSGHRAAQIGGAELVVRSSAIPDSNPEVQAAIAAGIPVTKRRGFLGELTHGQQTVAIAGTHGKTTTTALTAWLLYRTGHDPSFIAGSRLVDLGTNAHHGNGKAFVIEADEYDHMFLGLNPTVAVVTNIEHDHPDCYPTFADMQAAFREFAGKVPADGRLVACYDDPAARALADIAGAPTSTYGLEEGAEWRAEAIQLNRLGGSDFLVTRKRAQSAPETLGLARIRLAGEHNVRNALAAIVVCDYMGVPLGDLLPALREFNGTGRRFEVKGEANGITVVDDYAHHPTEIRATLAAARARYEGRKIWAMFQPHTFSRTRMLMLDFASSFGNADHVLVSDIYRSRERDDGSVTAQDVVSHMGLHPDARYIGALDNAVDTLLAELTAGDVLITLGAGDSNTVADKVLSGLQG